jgi:hypothetical protein
LLSEALDVMAYPKYGQGEANPPIKERFRRLLARDSFLTRLAV